MANRWVNNGNRDRFHFLGLQKSLQMVTAAIKLNDACSLEELINVNIMKNPESRSGERDSISWEDLKGPNVNIRRQEGKT